MFNTAGQCTFVCSVGYFKLFVSCTLGEAFINKLRKVVELSL